MDAPHGTRARCSPFVDLLEKLKPNLEKWGIDTKSIHISPYKGGTGGGGILPSGEIILDAEALTKLQGLNGMSAEQSATAILLHENRSSSAWTL